MGKVICTRTKKIPFCTKHWVLDSYWTGLLWCWEHIKNVLRTHKDYFCGCNLTLLIPIISNPTSVCTRKDARPGIKQSVQCHCWHAGNSKTILSIFGVGALLWKLRRVFHDQIINVVPAAKQLVVIIKITLITSQLQVPTNSSCSCDKHQQEIKAWTEALS